MDKEELSFSTKYQRSYSVRRRRSNDEIFLIKATELVRIDAFSDQVFTLCDGKADVLAMIKAMVSRYSNLDPVSVAAHTLYNLRYFRDHGMIGDCE